MNDSRPADPTFGYLDCVEDDAFGVTGGYLIVSSTGRPLEFRCTAPVKASVAQQILFGATLRSHLLGEQIGAALVERASLKPTLLVLTEPDLAAPRTKTPLLVINEHAPTGYQPLGDRELQCWTKPETAELVAPWRDQLAGSIELAEPFERIRLAIREAQRIGQEEAHRDAA